MIGSPWQLLRHPEFRACDVAIFHWGIHYVLFDAITLLAVPALPAPVVHFHNCTPPALVEEIQRDHLLRSIQQLHHVIAMDVPLWTYSEFNRRTLIDWGAVRGADRLGHVPCPRAGSSRRRSMWRHRQAAVGRSAGAGEGCACTARSARDPAGSTARTHPAAHRQQHHVLLGRLPGDIEGEGPRRSATARQVRRVPRLAIGRRSSPRCTEDADVVISTSFHEGLCVPLIEGYAAGCRAIGTTAGNLPYVVFAPDPVVPPGDPACTCRSHRERRRQPRRGRFPLPQPVPGARGVLLTAERDGDAEARTGRRPEPAVTLTGSGVRVRRVTKPSGRDQVNACSVTRNAYRTRRKTALTSDRVLRHCPSVGSPAARCTGLPP